MPEHKGELLCQSYLKGGYRKTPITRLFYWVMRTFPMSFMLHIEFSHAKVSKN